MKQNYYYYGMRMRGFAPWCQPMNGLIGNADDGTDRYHSIIVYDRELTAEELDEYELDAISVEANEPD